MTYLTIRERARTFPLDLLLAAKRRAAKVCLICGSCSTPAAQTACIDCETGTGPTLVDPDNLIVLNLTP